MPLTWVEVHAPAGQGPVQNVYVNRRFRRPAGLTGTPFQVEIGDNTFSLRSGGVLTANEVVNCPDAPQTAPFRINLTALVLAMIETSPSTTVGAKKMAKKSGPKRAARKPAAKPKAPKPKTARKNAAKRKTAGRKKPARKKAARKTARRRSR